MITNFLALMRFSEPMIIVMIFFAEIVFTAMWVAEDSPIDRFADRFKDSGILMDFLGIIIGWIIVAAAVVIAFGSLIAILTIL